MERIRAYMLAISICCTYIPSIHGINTPPSYAELVKAKLRSFLSDKRTAWAAVPLSLLLLGSTAWYLWYKSRALQSTLSFPTIKKGHLRHNRNITLEQVKKIIDDHKTAFDAIDGYLKQHTMPSPWRGLGDEIHTILNEGDKTALEELQRWLVQFKTVIPKVAAHIGLFITALMNLAPILKIEYKAVNAVVQKNQETVQAIVQHVRNKHPKATIDIFTDEVHNLLTTGNDEHLSAAFIWLNGFKKLLTAIPPADIDKLIADLRDLREQAKKSG